jgi:hypothetical protein
MWVARLIEKDWYPPMQGRLTCQFNDFASALTISNSI